MGVTVTMRAEERGVAREEGGTGEAEEDAEEEEEEGAADTLVTTFPTFPQPHICWRILYAFIYSNSKSNRKRTMKTYQLKDDEKTKRE